MTAPQPAGTAVAAASALLSLKSGAQAKLKCSSHDSAYGAAPACPGCTCSGYQMWHPRVLRMCLSLPPQHAQDICGPAVLLPECLVPEVSLLVPAPESESPGAVAW